MRVRTLFTLAVGASAGAGAMYLMDPVHGPTRRRQLRRSALRNARDAALVTLREARRQASDMVTAAVVGYQQVQREVDEARPGA